MAEPFTLLHPEGRADVSVVIEGDGVRISGDCVRDVLGWELTPQGLCLASERGSLPERRSLPERGLLPERGAVCIPVADPAALADDRGIDLAALADVLGLPLALDTGARAAALGTSHLDRAARLDTLEAPDFTLPDVAGAMHSLSDYRGKKVLLIAYASW